MPRKSDAMIVSHKEQSEFPVFQNFEIAKRGHLFWRFIAQASDQTSRK